jgi:hypothetical protein
MSLLENPTTYNLSDSKFSLGVAIFDGQAEEFVDLNYFYGLLWIQTWIGSKTVKKEFYNDFKPCNTTNGDFDEINLNATVYKWKQGEMINQSMCFDMKKAMLKSDITLFGKGFILNFR